MTSRKSTTEKEAERFFQNVFRSKHNLAQPEVISYKQAHIKSLQYTRDIFTAQRRLVAILDTHQATLAKRWLKKSTAQKIKVLRTAWPEIPASHRPDLKAAGDLKTSTEKAESTNPDYFLLGSLNFENLSKPQHLLNFVESRARNPPCIFARQDADSTHFGNEMLVLKVDYLPSYTMLLIGQDTEATYGRMIAFKIGDEAFEKLDSGIGFQPGEGLQVLEVQQRKMHFLVKCVETILQGQISVDGPVHCEPSLCEDSFPVPNPDWPSISQTMEDSQYNVPERFDIGRIRSIIEAKRNQVEDHLWALREEPAYFQQVVEEWSQHRYERIIDSDGCYDPEIGGSKFWHNVLVLVITEAYEMVVFWSSLWNEVRRFEELIAVKGLPQQPDELIEPPLLHFLTWLDFTIDNLIKGPIGLFKVGLVTAPNLRCGFERKWRSKEGKDFSIGIKNTTSNNNDRLLRLAEILIDEKLRHPFGVENICDEIDRELRSDEETRRRLSPWMAHVLSDLSLYVELKRQLAILNPLTRMQDSPEQCEDQTGFPQWARLLKGIHDTMALNQDLATLGLPLTLYRHPSSELQDRVANAVIQKGEVLLDRFWLEFDWYCVQKVGCRLQQALRDILDADQQPERTPDWLEPPPEAESDDSEEEWKWLPPFHRGCEANDGDAAEGDRDASNDGRFHDDITGSDQASLDGSSIMWNDQYDSDDGVSTTSTLIDQTDQARTLSQSTQPAPTFQVTKRKYKVFTMLFHPSDAADVPPNLSWSDFVSAMAGIGLSPKRLHGSGWLFTPDGDTFGQGVVFHEPWPGKEIPFHMAKTMGRTLQRLYGLDGSSFERA